jgi:hypothetical protein
MQFNTLLESITSCYSKDFKELIPQLKSFPDQLIRNSDEINLADIEAFGETQNNKFIHSTVKRIIAIKNIQAARANETLIDTKHIWNLIMDSILQLPPEGIIATIGSQGFLSIPLMRYLTDLNNFDFIRLHIWDDSLTEYMDSEKTEMFSIHSHAFHAHSWILAGKVLNERYSVNKTNLSDKLSLFTIQYDKSLKDVNQHTSVARNTNDKVETYQLSREEYMSGSFYQIKEENFHRSDNLGVNGLSATIFSFSSKNRAPVTSYVVGPNRIKESEINRSITFNPLPLIKKINTILKDE